MSERRARVNLEILTGEIRDDNNINKMANLKLYINEKDVLHIV